MGAIIRSAEFFGISAIVVPIRESAPINETVYKTSSGAVEYENIAG
jgi:23S rRNA (guanosine2251-2'-O)-methyltransferase